MKIISLEKLKQEPSSHSPKIMKKVMLKKGDVPRLTSFSQAYFRPGQIAAEHVHPDMYEIYLVESGTGLIKVNGKVHQLTAGGCVMTEPGEAHEFINTGKSDFVLSYFGIEK